MLLALAGIAKSLFRLSVSDVVSVSRHRQELVKFSTHFCIAIAKS